MTFTATQILSCSHLIKHLSKKKKYSILISLGRRLMRSFILILNTTKIEKKNRIENMYARRKRMLLVSFRYANVYNEKPAILCK